MSAPERPLTSPPELAPSPIRDDTTVEQRIAIWVDLMNAADATVLAWLQREIGPDGDLQAAEVLPADGGARPDDVEPDAALRAGTRRQ